MVEFQTNLGVLNMLGENINNILEDIAFSNKKAYWCIDNIDKRTIYCSKCYKVTDKIEEYCPNCNSKMFNYT